MNGTNIYLNNIAYDAKTMNTPSQQFTYSPADKTIRLNSNKNKCIDLHSMDNNTPLQIWDCNGTAAQQFTIDKKSELDSTKFMNSTVDIAKQGVKLIGSIFGF